MHGLFLVLLLTLVLVAIAGLGVGLFSYGVLEVRIHGDNRMGLIHPDDYRQLGLGFSAIVGGVVLFYGAGKFTQYFAAFADYFGPHSWVVWQGGFLLATVVWLIGFWAAYRLAHVPMPQPEYEYPD